MERLEKMQVGTPARHPFRHRPFLFDIETEFYQPMKQNFVAKPFFPRGPGSLTHRDRLRFAVLQKSWDRGKITLAHLKREFLPLRAERRHPVVGQNYRHSTHSHRFK